MKNVLVFVFLLTILALPTKLLGTSGTTGAVPDQTKVKDVKPPNEKEKSVPAPDTVLLLGVAGAVTFGVRKLWQSSH